MRVLVTGCAGFIGSHLCDYLVEKGHKVSGLDNLVSGRKEFLNPEVEFYEGDIRFPIFEGGIITNLTRAFEKETPDIVFHLAAVSRTPWAIQKPLYTYETNVVGSANVLEVSKRMAVRKVVLASSNIVYAAQTPYKSSKLAMEMVARDYNDLYDLPTLCLRFSNVYGAVGDKPLRQNPDNVLASLSKAKKERGKIFITGDGTQTRNFTHVSDICEALYLAAGMSHLHYRGEAIQPDIHYPNSTRGSARGTEIDIMNERTWSLNEVAKFFDCPVEYLPERKGDVKHLQMTGTEKAKRLLGFEAKRELSDFISPYL